MKTIDFANWPRYKHFLMFQQFDYPHFNLCAPVDITRLIKQLKEPGFSFTITFTYLVARIANDIPAFRQRIRGDIVVEHDIVHPSPTILSRDNLYSYCLMPFEQEFRSFHKKATGMLEKVRQDPTLEDEPGHDDLLFISSLPWVSFTGISHPIQMHPVDSIPRISWGKFSSNGQNTTLPVSVQCHHGLMDGYHMGLFYQQLQELCDHPTFLSE